RKPDIPDADHFFPNPPKQTIHRQPPAASITHAPCPRHNCRSPACGRALARCHWPGQAGELKQRLAATAMRGDGKELRAEMKVDPAKVFSGPPARQPSGGRRSLPLCKASRPVGVGLIRIAMVWAVALAPSMAAQPAQAQSNLDAGKSAAQIFADTC